MSGPSSTRLGLMLAALLAASACSEDQRVSSDTDPSMQIAPGTGDAAVSPAAAPTVDGGTSAASPGTRADCIDRPSELARAASKELPCELFPPNFVR
jgi:hypothetical protein